MECYYLLLSPVAVHKCLETQNVAKKKKNKDKAPIKLLLLKKTATFEVFIRKLWSSPPLTLTRFFSLLFLSFFLSCFKTVFFFYNFSILFRYCKLTNLNNTFINRVNMSTYRKSKNFIIYIFHSFLSRQILKNNSNTIEFALLSQYISNLLFSFFYARLKKIFKII